MPRLDASLLGPVFAVALVACATPSRPVSTAPEPVRAVQSERRQPAIDSLRDQQRVEDVGRTLLAAATPFCGAAPTEDTGCRFKLVAAQRDDIHAAADATTITVPSAMLRFVANDDELAAILAHEIAHNALGHARAQDPRSTVYSQDVEGEADYVGMYLLARAGRPFATAANVWRRMAEENPVGMTYASAHPTTPDRLVRLQDVSREIEQKIARGAELRPETPAGFPSPSTAVAQAPANAAAAKSGAPGTVGVLVDRGSRSTVLMQVPRESTPTRVSSGGAVALISTTTITRGDTVSYTFGPPAPRHGLSLSEVQRHAREAFDDGREAFELRLYERAEAKLREATLYDGSQARYHAALGAILLKRGKRVEAEAVLSAAVLLDVENAEYRQLLVEARRRE